MPQIYEWIRKPIQARFRERLNRFACLVKIDDEPTKVYLPNSGRLEDLLVPGARVILEQRRQPGEAKTLYDMLLVESERYPDGAPLWVGLDSRMPPRLLRWVIEQNLLPQLGGIVDVQEEPRLEDSRLDLRLTTDAGIHLVEAKSVNLLDRNGVARFPDAPTTRGTRHLDTLIEQQQRASVQTWAIFIILRADARAFSPFSERDPDFAATLCRARDAGVGVLALSFAAGLAFRYLGPTDVRLPASPFPGFWPSSEDERSSRRPSRHG